MNYIIDFCFFIDIMICFRTSYLNEQGDFVMDTNKIAMDYIKSTFIVDLLATLPLDLMLSVSDAYVKHKAYVQRTGGVQWVELLGILKIGRVFRLSDIIQYLNSTEDFKGLLRFLKMILFLFIYIHCYACTWWLLIKSDRTWIPPKHSLDPIFFYKVYD